MKYCEVVTPCMQVSSSIITNIVNLLVLLTNSTAFGNSPPNLTVLAATFLEILRSRKPLQASLRLLVLYPIFNNFATTFYCNTRQIRGGFRGKKDFQTIKGSKHKPGSSHKQLLSELNSELLSRTMTKGSRKFFIVNPFKNENYN